MSNWALTALVMMSGLFLSSAVGGVAAALPHPPGARWHDRLRSGTKGFKTTLTLFTTVVGLLLILMWGQRP
ncbi:hypothetical protein GT352_03300 [Streptomyces sp. SID1046]|uniref:hypothetical protein n=1 Tax=Streptomyces sp. SID1046 TaxID=2690249 RepID=UPI0013716BFB|nr:hypothetical protein [Streptomyces sp. SID1046]MYV72982.1 hypothetical protein [Streptomyces sp. SID1046]